MKELYYQTHQERKAKTFRILLYAILLIIPQFSWSQNVLHTSPNPKADEHIEKKLMVKLSLQDLFNPETDLFDGLIMHNPGNISFNIYEYDESTIDGKGLLLYSVNGSTSSSDDNDFVGDPVILPTPSEWSDYQTPFSTNWNGDDIKLAAFIAAKKRYAEKYAPQVTEWLEEPLEVLIEVFVLSGTDFKRFKIPGFGEYEAGPFFRLQELKRKFVDPSYDPNYTIICAHRGYWKDAPEQSMKSFEDAIALEGIDMIEFDLRKTSDNIVFCFHDQFINRPTTYVASSKVPVTGLSWNEIKDLYLITRNGEVTTYKIPTLEEALKLAKGKVLINLDKSMDNFPETYELVGKLNMFDQCIFKGKSTVAEYQIQYPNLPVEDMLRNVIYTPVLFGDWEAGKVGSLVNEYLQNGIADAFELNFKKPGDAGYNLIPTIQQNNRRVGIFATWPEYSQGHIQEGGFAFFEYDATKDYRGDQDFLIKGGADYLITDRCSLTLDYLRAIGKHN